MGEYLSAITGWKLWAWVGAALGAAAGVAAAPEMTRPQQIITYCCGLACGGVLGPITCWRLGIPYEFSCAVGFILGVPGMRIVRFIIIISSDPWAAWGRFKGRSNG
jgi:hypothetical protein